MRQYCPDPFLPSLVHLPGERLVQDVGEGGGEFKVGDSSRVRGGESRVGAAVWWGYGTGLIYGARAKVGEGGNPKSKVDWPATIESVSSCFPEKESHLS